MFKSNRPNICVRVFEKIALTQNRSGNSALFSQSSITYVLMEKWAVGIIEQNMIV